MEQFATLEDYINHFPNNLQDLIIPLEKFKDSFTSLPRDILLRFTKLRLLKFDSPQINHRPGHFPNVITYPMYKLPDLPNSLKYLKCERLALNELPLLPSSLEKLEAGYNYLTKLSNLPPSLKELDVDFNHLTDLPELPSGLRYLNASYNGLTHLPNLPVSLISLAVIHNNLICLPHLPSSLHELYCGDNEIEYLPKLPNTLNSLYVDNNEIRILPELPISLRDIDIENNPLAFDIENKRIRVDYNETSLRHKGILELRTKIDTILNVLYRVKHLFYSLKFKKHFHNLLWVKIREPKTRLNYHPDNLKENVEKKEILV